MSKALKVVEQREVTFYDDELTAVRLNDGTVYVSLTSMCSALGIDLSSQTKRVKRQEVLEEGYTVKMTVQGDQRRRTGLLRADLVPLWLTGLSTGSVKEEMRDKIKRYQKEAAKVLWEAFQEGRLTAEVSLAADTDFEQLLQHTDNEAVQAYQIASAIVKLARSHLLMEKRLTGRLDHHEERLEEIEITLGDPDRWVTPKQASQISQAVKAVAVVYGKKTKRNEFGAVYGELYRKFDITAYKELPAKKFRSAMNWLTEWYQSLTDDEVPFLLLL